MFINRERKSLDEVTAGDRTQTPRLAHEHECRSVLPILLWDVVFLGEQPFIIGLYRLNSTAQIRMY